MTDLEIMRAARALITPPGSWTQREAARDIDGQSTFPLYDDAICFCSLGAIDRAMGPERFYVQNALADHILRKYKQGVVAWNDHPTRTHAEVLAEFDEVIAKLEGVQ
jgi:hypothetical protein